MRLTRLAGLQRAEIKNVVADEMGRAMERLEGMFERGRFVEEQRSTFAEGAKPKVAFPNIRTQPRSRQNMCWWSTRLADPTRVLGMLPLRPRSGLLS